LTHIGSEKINTGLRLKAGTIAPADPQAFIERALVARRTASLRAPAR
jgi:hypothetical protein